jgi:hypothetical protein
METGGQMETLQASAERWVNLTGSDGKVKGRLNLDTGELVIRDRGLFHKWPLRSLLNCTSTQGTDTGKVLQSP